MATDIYNIERLLCDKRLMQALGRMRPLIDGASSYQLTDRWHALYRNYSYMLQFFLSGQNDPAGKDILQSMIVDALALLDDISFRQMRSTASYHTNKMYDKALKGSDNSLKDIFYHAWTAEQTTTDKAEKTADELAMLIPAITIRVLQHFSEDKILELAQYIHSGDARTSALAMVGWVLICKKYERRLDFYPFIKQEQELLLSTDLREKLLFVVRCILNTVLTPRVNKEMQSLQQDIMPKIKLNNKGEKQANIVINIDEMEEGNPDWDEEMNDIMGKHYENMMKLKNEGADFNYSTTKDILSDSFFHDDIANWFIPFDRQNEELKIDWDDQKSKLLKGMLLAMEDACDLDKYAMCRVFNRVNDINLKDNLPSVVNEMASMSETAEIDQKPPRSFNAFAELYVKVLYRFFYNNPWQISNELADAGNICATKLFTKACQHSELPFFVDRCVSLQLYDVVTTIARPTTAKDWQQLGFAYQKQKDYRNAADAYQKALLLKENKWTMQHLAAVQYYLGNVDEAVRIIDRLLENDADNTDYLKQKARFLFESERDEQAMKVLFQLQLLLPKDENIMRSLGWCAFRQGKIDVAEKYLEKTASNDKAEAADMLNYAHVLFAKKQRDKALAIYMQARDKYENISDFIAAFVGDVKVLKTVGISSDDILLMEESIIMKLTDEKI